MEEAILAIRLGIIEFQASLLQWLDVKKGFDKEGTVNESVNSIILDIGKKIRNMNKAIKILTK
jgi:hypothetical protein